MAKFNLGDVFNVSELDTGEERIEYLPLAELKEDERNFYSIGGVEELADNIRFCGLQQPIRVRRDGEGYVILSGHRRTAALRVLAEEEPEKWRSVPCIVERGSDSPAMQELKLILANRDTRAMSSADVANQASRVQELFVQLKDEGVEFKGRMRDAVAKACDISASRLARLNAIKTRLSDEKLVAAYQAGNLPEETAYQLSRLSDYAQSLVSEKFTGKDGKISLYGSTAEKIAKLSGEIAFPKKCPCGSGSCSEFPLSARLNAITSVLKRSAWYLPITCASGCCMKCDNRNSCAVSCRHAADARAKHKEEEKAEKREQNARAAAAAARIQQERLEIWSQFFKVLDNSDTDWEQLREAVQEHTYGLPDEKTVDAARKGDSATIDRYLPFGYLGGLKTIRLFRAAAAALGCTIDDLIGERKTAGEAEEKAAEPPARHNLQCVEEGGCACICLSCRHDHNNCCCNDKHGHIGCEICEGECPDYEPEAE